MKKIKVVIKRSEWGTGEEGGALLGSNGKMCCLGFICEQAFKVDRNEFFGAGYFPSGRRLESLMHSDDPAVAAAAEYYLNFSQFRVAAASLNDSGKPRDVIERELLELFADSPFDVSFVD